MSAGEFRSILQGLAPRPLPPELAAARLRFRFELEDGTARDVLLRDGRLSLPDEEGPPDAVLRCAPESLVPALSGRLNLMTAVMRGDVELRGNPAAAVLLHAFGRRARAQEPAP